MRTKSIIFLISLFAPFLFQYCSRLAITNTNLFDPITGSMLPNSTILIAGDRITAIGSRDNPIKLPYNCQIIDGSDKYVIPGLIDAHVHLVFLLDKVNVKGEDVLPLYLGNGVTSVRDIGDQIVPQKEVADFAETHRETCPTVFMCSPLIDGLNPMHTAGYTINDPARVPGYIDTLVSYGITTLKMYVGIDTTVFKKVIEEGHRHGLTVSAHLPLRYVKTKNAIDWGLDVIEHIWGVSNDSLMIGKMAAQGMMVDPTLVVFKNMIYLPDLPEVWQSTDNCYVPDTLLSVWDEYRTDPKFNEQNRQLRKSKMDTYKNLTYTLYRAGVTLLAGTDTPEPYCPPGFALHDELVLLVESGLSPAAALKCATINNAHALKQTNNLGSIENGKIADMVILNANPLEDIRNTRTIFRVIHQGIVCDPQSVLPAPAVTPKNISNQTGHWMNNSARFFNTRPLTSPNDAH
jgi:imidazolonepropionase-like amidohydrolase